MSETSILIVEDEGSVAEDLACTVRQFGYEVVGTTSTGEEAVQLALLHRPDLVLMDISLAGTMDAIEAAQQIHLENNLPILFLSAHSDAATTLRAQTVEAAGIILKPFKDQDLRVQIEMSLNKFRSEKKLRESETRYRLLAETMLQGVVHQDADGTIIAMNPAARKILGKTDKIFLGSNSTAVEHHTVRENGTLFPGHEHPSMVALQTGRPVRKAVMGVFNPQLAEYRWISIDAIPVFMNEKSGPAEVYTVFEDITDRKSSEERQARLAAIVTSADDAIIGMDPDNTVQTWNAGAEKIFGYRSAEMIGQNIDLLLPPGCKQEATEFLHKVQSSNKIQKFESINRKKNGTLFPVLVTLSSITDTTGKVIGVSKIAHNISEQKRTEAERKATVECLCFVNESKTIQSLIQNTLSFFQQLSGCEGVGIRMKKDGQYPYLASIGFRKEIFGTTHGQCSFTAAEKGHLNKKGNPMLDCLCSTFEAAGIPAGKAFFISEGTFWCNSTTELLASMTATTTSNSASMCCINAGYESVALIPFGLGTENLGYLQLNDPQKGKFSAQAITLWARLANHVAVALAKFQADEALADLLARLEFKVQERTVQLQEMQQLYLHTEKLAAIGKLSASIAHEFNNPLQGIMSILNGVKRRAVLEQEDKELIDIATNEGNRIKNLIQSLHDFNRPSSGIMATMDVHRCLDSLLLLNKHDLNKKQIVVETHYTDDLPAITAVSEQIKQVFLNLLTNAADSCGNDGGVLRISTWKDDNMVAVAITDKGIGIQPQDKEQIFRPFYTTKSEVKGIGLGLSVSYGIIKKHGGDIQVESTPGHGSTFTVKLPINNNQD
ncbi:MAG: PAS domain S-box protein [Desulfobulbus sp.]|nr:PAS domain S-box protein [Desulfobulbus sp.]